MAGLCAPLSTLRQYPRGHLRMTRGRCGSLLLHRDGLAPSTPCRSPGALRSSPESGLKSDIGPCPFRADSVAKVPKAAAAKFSPKNETTDNRRSIEPQTRCQNRL